MKNKTGDEKKKILNFFLKNINFSSFWFWPKKKIVNELFHSS